jgi:phospholipid/cholesterol/gamma-HCH transport system ATP-binding protein
MNSAYHVGDRLALLNEGRIVFTGTPDEARNTRDPLVKQFIEGSSEGPIKPL